MWRWCEDENKCENSIRNGLFEGIKLNFPQELSPQSSWNLYSEKWSQHDFHSAKKENFFPCKNDHSTRRSSFCLLLQSTLSSSGQTTGQLGASGSIKSPRESDRHDYTKKWTKTMSREISHKKLCWPTPMDDVKNLTRVCNGRQWWTTEFFIFRLWSGYWTLGIIPRFWFSRKFYWNITMFLIFLDPFQCYNVKKIPKMFKLLPAVFKKGKSTVFSFQKISAKIFRFLNKIYHKNLLVIQNFDVLKITIIFACCNCIREHT